MEMHLWTRTILQRTLKNLIILGNIFAGPTALAGNEWQYMDSKFAATATLNDQTEIYREAKESDQQSFLQLVNDSGALYSDLRSSIDSMLGDSFRRVSQYRGHSVSFSGRLRVDLSGRGGLSDLKITVPSIRASAQFKQVVLAFVSVSCNVDISIDDLVVTGDVDVLSGTINHSFARGTPNIQRSCSGNLPIIGSLVASLAEHVLDGITEKISSRFSAGSGIAIRAKSFLGLNISLRDGRFMVAGFDVGQYVRTNLSSLIYNNDVSISIQDPAVVPSAGPAQDEESITTTRHEILKLSFPRQRLALALSNERRYKSVYVCRGKKFSCFIDD